MSAHMSIHKPLHSCRPASSSLQCEVRFGVCIHRAQHLVHVDRRAGTLFDRLDESFPTMRSTRPNRCPCACLCLCACAYTRLCTAAGQPVAVQCEVCFGVASTVPDAASPPELSIADAGDRADIETHRTCVHGHVCSPVRRHLCRRAQMDMCVHMYVQMRADMHTWACVQTCV